MLETFGINTATMTAFGICFVIGIIIKSMK